VSARLRPALALALSASVLAGGAALAAPKPKPVCNLLSDAKGDAYPTTAAPGGPSDEALDVVTADIASDKKTLTAVIRLSKVAEQSSTSPTGYHLVFNFTAPGAENPLYLQYFSGNEALEQSFDFGYDDAVNGLTSLGDADGVIDTAKNEIRISAPISGFAEQASIKPGQKLGDLVVQSTRDLLVLLPYADIAEGGAPYTVGAPSCVIPGK
jgi:hypothetical protein